MERTWISAGTGHTAISLWIGTVPRFFGVNLPFSFVLCLCCSLHPFFTLTICLLFSRAALAPPAQWACLHFIAVPTSLCPDIRTCPYAYRRIWVAGLTAMLLPCQGLCHRERWCGARYAYHIFNFSKENNCSSLLNKVQYHFSNGGVKKQRKFGCFWQKNGVKM